MTDEIYPIAAGSPQTALSAAYTFGNSSFAVDDHTKLLDAPNITTIVAPTGEFITVGYTDITGSVVSGITLKDGYSSFIFPIGSVVYRSWSKYDHDVFSDHISDLEDEKVDKALFDAHLVDTTNPHATTKAQVGLENCDNTSDANKPVSTAQATAIGLKAPTSHASTATTYGVSSSTNYGHAMASSTTPIVASTATVGSEDTKFARGNHVHPAQTSVSGNSGTSTKLATARAIDGVNFDGSAAVSRYVVCATIAKTAAKAVSISGYTLVSGAVSVVKFTNGNVANSPTLNITSTGAKPITRKGVVISPEKIEVGGTYVFVYDGTNYEIIGSYIDNSPITVHGMIIDETNSDPKACISYIGASAGLDLAARKAVFESTHPLVVVKAAEELFTVDPADWSKKLDGTASGVTTDGLSLDGNFVIRYPTFWFRIQTLGTDIHSIEWTHDNPGSGNGWVCCHLRDGTIRDKVWVGVTEGIIDGGKLRSIFSHTELPTVSRTSEQFYTAAQATGTAEGVTGENPYTITQPLVYIMRCILKYWTYGTLNFQTDVARGIADDTVPSEIGLRPVCVGVSPTGGYTQGTPASSQEHTDNVSAVVCGEIDPYGNVNELTIDFAYRFGEIAFATDAADHFDVGTLTLSPDNWDSAIPATWQKVTGVGTIHGAIRRMLWNAYYPFISASAGGGVGGSALTYWSDGLLLNAEDTAENKVPRQCVTGGSYHISSTSGPAAMRLDYAVEGRTNYVGARLQIFSKE